MIEQCWGRTTLQTKDKGGGISCIQHNSGFSEEGIAPKIKGRSDAWFLYASLTFGSRFSLQYLGMRENKDETCFEEQVMTIQDSLQLNIHEDEPEAPRVRDTMMEEKASE